MDKNILYTAIQAALAAGAEIMSVYTDPKADFEIEKKADNSPLTIADRKSHAIIAQALTATPYPVLSEEGAKIAPEERQQWKELWVVDTAIIGRRCFQTRLTTLNVVTHAKFMEILFTKHRGTYTPHRRLDHSKCGAWISSDRSPLRRPKDTGSF